MNELRGGIGLSIGALVRRRIVLCGREDRSQRSSSKRVASARKVNRVVVKLDGR